LAAWRMSSSRSSVVRTPGSSRITHQMSTAVLKMGAHSGR
jgi:hypothetical protein